MEQTLVDLSIYEIFAIYGNCQRLLKHSLSWLEFITKGSSYRLEIALTVLGVILSSVYTNFYTLSFEVVEVFNSALNLIG